MQGGASRAGYWTATTFAALREAARNLHGKDNGFDIGQHIFAISSVSGGSVGSVGYLALSSQEPGLEDDKFRTRILSFAGQDALGPALTGFMFSDLSTDSCPSPSCPTGVRRSSGRGKHRGPRLTPSRQTLTSSPGRSSISRQDQQIRGARS